MDKLKKLRERIDWLDTQIASLLNERMRATDQVGKIKRNNQIVVTDQSREKIVLDRVEEMVQHPVLKANIANIYSEIMQESKIAQQFFQFLSIPFRRIGIIGLGLMGGSICKGIKLKDHGIEIGTVKLSMEDHAMAVEGGWIDREYDTLEQLTAHSELIILASPLSTVIPFAEEIKRAYRGPKKLLVMDIASAKGEIAEAFETLSCGKVEYFATHPMAGREKSGFSNSKATLFVHRPWVIVPHAKNEADHLDKVKEIVRFLGSEPICMEAALHDKRAALISHLPSILSKLYLDFVNETDPESVKIAGPGFQSFTRLGNEREEKREEFVKHNQQAIQQFLDQWLEKINHKKEA